jgi:hypothetical protein
MWLKMFMSPSVRHCRFSPLKQLHVAAVAVGEREVQVMAPAASVVFKKVDKKIRNIPR